MNFSKIRLQICIPMLDKLNEQTCHWYLFVVDLSVRKGYVLDSCRLADESGRIGDCEKMVCSKPNMYRHKT